MGQHERYLHELTLPVCLDRVNQRSLASSASIAEALGLLWGIREHDVSG
jgi:hypothetical protein